MPHDCKGRLVEVGDIVKGKGYNVKHEIIGPVVSVTHGIDTCNIQVAYPVLHRDAHFTGYGYVRAGSVLQASVEYGQADAFEILEKEDGSLPSDIVPPSYQPV